MTWKYLLRPIRSRASTMFFRSRLETTAQGVRAVQTASSHSSSPSTGLLSWYRILKKKHWAYLHYCHYYNWIKARKININRKNNWWELLLEEDSHRITVKALVSTCLTHFPPFPTAEPEVKIIREIYKINHASGLKIEELMVYRELALNHLFKM